MTDERPRANADPGARSDVDRELLGRLRAGDVRAADELFQRHIGRVRAHLYRITGASQELDDLCQKVFLEAWRALPSYRGEALISTWLVQIAIHVAVDHLRALKRRPPPLSLVTEPAAASVGAERQLASRELFDALHRCLDSLKPKKRVAFVLHVVLGHTLKEVAALTGSSERAVRAQVLRARKELMQRSKRDAKLSTLLATTEKEAAS